MQNRSEGLPATVAALVAQQRAEWPLMREGYAALREIETRNITIARSNLVIQHNPRRIISTAARVDRDSIEARRCFLCAASLPPEEKGIAYESDMIILCNPFPILDNHLSIVHRRHIAQQIEGNVEILLRLARDLSPAYFVLYNGPECGASAPDHLHFQACSRTLLPVEDDLRRSISESKNDAISGDGAAVFMPNETGRSVIVFRSAEISRLARLIYGALDELSKETAKAEPMVNIICTHEEGEWRVFLFPRARHRPSYYFAEDGERLTVSPGAIDMAGVIVVPRREDFARIDASHIEQIFSEVSLSKEKVDKVIENLMIKHQSEPPAQKEPLIRVGLVTGVRAARVTLHGRFTDANGVSFTEGDYTATAENGAISLDGDKQIRARSLSLSPVKFDDCRFTVHDVVIGIDFHWERKESQSFQGTLELRASEEGLIVVNELPLEAYLISVISSEMSAYCPVELLRAHAIVARGWLLAQLQGTQNKTGDIAQRASRSTQEEIIRWYDRENHAEFDVCADDHCQRYQGISKAFSQAAFDAVSDTRGKVLMSEGEICDTRYAKSCGGRTEIYSAAWENMDVPYLSSIYDGEDDPDGYILPLSVESNAEAWIASSPEAYCNAASSELLSRILTSFDQETQNFYRWEVDYSGDELSEIIEARLGRDLGRIVALEPIERGHSGRIIRLRITGEKESFIIGKELEIRRTLARSHLYSSAFVVRSEQNPATGFIERVRLIGAGWGHGVGLCQIGAAVMADIGHSHEEILAHYFRNTRLSALY